MSHTIPAGATTPRELAPRERFAAAFFSECFIDELARAAWRDPVQYRREITRDLRAQARTIGENSTAAITFEDPRSAGETLAVLEIHPNVVYACMFRSNGPLFSTYFCAGGGAFPAAAAETPQPGRCGPRMAIRVPRKATGKKGVKALKLVGTTDRNLDDADVLRLYCVP